jgi:hypothetical protein
VPLPLSLAHISPSASVRALIAFVRSRRCETHSPVAGQIGRGVKANRGGDPANHGEMISERTKAALQAAKKRGQRLGNPGIAEAAKLGRAALKANARRFAANVRPIINEIVRAGATSHNAIAAKLNERNVRTARGGVWTHVQVGAILHPFEDVSAAAA